MAIWDTTGTPPWETEKHLTEYWFDRWIVWRQKMSKKSGPGKQNIGDQMQAQFFANFFARQKR